MMLNKVKEINNLLKQAREKQQEVNSLVDKMTKLGAEVYFTNKSNVSGPGKLIGCKVQLDGK